MNPYTDQTFWGFFATAFQRLFQLLPLDQWTIDEVQLAVLALLGVGSALVGSWLVVRRMALMANALSHGLLIGIVAAYALIGSTHFPALLIGALLAGCVTSGCIEWLTRVVRLSDDAAISLIQSALFSLGVVALTLITRDSHIGTEIVMGQVDALHADDVRQVAWVTLVNGLMGLLLFRGYLITSFDSALARSLGFSSAWYGRLLMAQVSLTSIVAFRAVGVVLVVGLLIVPPLTARLWVHRIGHLMLLAAGISLCAALVGVALSRHMLSVYQMPLSTSGIVVVLLGVFYVGSRAAIAVRHWLAGRERIDGVDKYKILDIKYKI